MEIYCRFNTIEKRLVLLLSLLSERVKKVVIFSILAAKL